MEKTPIRVEWIGDAEGGGDIEIAMELGYFESSGVSIREDIREFKKKYLEALDRAKKIDAGDDSVKPHRISSRQRWRACKILADFNSEASNQFEIINYKQAYARDFGLPLRSIRTYLDFGQYFAEDEIIDQIPYSIYAELAFRVGALKSKGLFDAEKKRLLKMGSDKTLPSRNEYRSQLNTLTDSS